MPTKPVCYNSQHHLTCEVQENLNTLPTWQLERDDIVYDITNGTESEVTSTAMDTQVKLKNIAELWEGMFATVFTSDIFHLIYIFLE